MIFVIRPNNDVLQRVYHTLAELNPAKEWDVEIKPHSKKRSNPANALYWKWLEIIGDDMGYTKDELHDEFASRFVGVVSKATISGKLLAVPASTSALSTKDFAEYMDKVYAFAHSQGITLPTPDYYGV